METEAHRWMHESLIEDGRPRLSTSQAIELVKSQPPAFQTEILKACVEVLPELRKRWSDRDVYKTGEQLYDIAVKLYGTKLPLEEPDICGLLTVSQHGCGHGCDVQSPLDLAIAHLAKHEASPELLSAIAAYAEGLKGIGSIQAQTVKRKVAILLLLDRTEKLGKRQKRAWSRRFTRDLETMGPEERLAWQELVLSFKLNERCDLPKNWRKIAGKFIGNVGEERLLSRVGGWWPEPGEQCTLDTGGSHLLKHLVWLLETVEEDSENKARCDALIRGLAEVEWKPLQPAAKVVCAAAHYLVQRPKSTAWEPLQKLCTMASSREDRVRELWAEYEKPK